MPPDGARFRNPTDRLKAGGASSSGKEKGSASPLVSNASKRSRSGSRSDSLSEATVHVSQMPPPSRRQAPAKKSGTQKGKSSLQESDDDQQSQELEHAGHGEDDDDDDEENEGKENEDEGGDESENETKEVATAGATKLSRFSSSPSVQIASA